MRPRSAVRSPARRAATAAATATALVGLAACGRGDAATAPPPAPPRAAAPPAATARAYLDSALSWEHQVFYWVDRVDWAAQGASIRAREPGLTWTNDRGDSTTWNLVDASLTPWLRNAPPTGPDDHSLFFPPSEAPGVVDASPDPRNLASGVTLGGGAGGPAALAYVWLPGFDGTNITGRVDSIQTVIRTLDQANPCGWLLDLRRNLGGYTDAMVAGINPVFGDAPASKTQPGYGGEVDRDNGRALYAVAGGTAGLYDPSEDKLYTFARATTPYTLKRPGSPVAVLIGPNTASAAEAITLGFRGSAVPSRSFGEPTYGVTTGPYGTYLQPDSGYLNVTASIMFDRTGQLYGGKLQPDELVTGSRGYASLTPTPAPGDPVIAAASAWLRTQSACAAGPAAAMAALRDRAQEDAVVRSRAAAQVARLPGTVQRLLPGATRRRVLRIPARLAHTAG